MSDLFKPLEERDFIYICDFCGAPEIDTETRQAATTVIVAHSEDKLGAICSDCVVDAIDGVNRMLKVLNEKAKAAKEARGHQADAEKVFATYNTAIEAAAKEACRWCKECVPVKITHSGVAGVHTFDDGSTSSCKAAGILALKKRGEDE